MTTLGFGSAPQNLGFQTQPLTSESTTDVRSETAFGVVLDNYARAKAQADEAKAQADEAKSAVLNWVQDQLQDGTNKFDTKFHSLKVVRSPTYSVTADDFQAMNATLQQIANMHGGEVASKLIQWKPSLDKRTYESLSNEAKALIDPFITMKYNAPTITVSRKDG